MAQNGAPTHEIERQRPLEAMAAAMVGRYTRGEFLVWSALTVVCGEADTCVLLTIVQ